MDLLKIAARVASSGPTVIMHFHVDDDHPNYAELADDDGTISSEFMAVVDKLGGSVEDWESNGMSISIPAKDEGAWVQHFADMVAGKHGRAAQTVAEAYGHEDTTDEDGETVPGPW